MLFDPLQQLYMRLRTLGLVQGFTLSAPLYSISSFTFLCVSLRHYTLGKNETFDFRQDYFPPAMALAKPNNFKTKLYTYMLIFHMQEPLLLQMQYFRENEI